LAILYTLVAITLVFLGGGKFSLDAKMLSKSEAQSTWENKSEYGQRI
jgi:hypothetical protein